MLLTCSNYGKGAATHCTSKNGTRTEFFLPVRSLHLGDPGFRSEENSEIHVPTREKAPGIYTVINRPL
jgi:hypothetical protein